MIRITTGGVLKGYRSSLNDAFIRLNNSVNTVMNTRLFNSYAEDPSSASQAFQVRRSILRNQAQLTVCSSIKGKYEQAYDALSSARTSICESITDSAKYTYLRARNDPTGDARTTLAKAFKEQAETVVQCMNSTYGNDFIFAGADGLNVPFELRDDGKLYYRGIAVDTEVPDVQMELDGTTQVMLNDDGYYDTSGANGTNYIISGSTSTVDPTNFTVGTETDANGNIVPVLEDDEGNVVHHVLTDANGNAVTVNADGVPDVNGDYYLVTDNIETISQEDYEQAETDLAKLDYLSTESYYLDIGLGFQWDNDSNSLISSSGFDAALQGINFVGYGVDEDGDPKNIVSLMLELGKMCEEYTTEEGWDWEKFDRLCNKFEAALQRFEEARIEQDAATNKILSSYDLLDNKGYTLNVQLSELEDVDEAAALTDYLYAQYCYNAALKVGNSILSPSLMDYLS